MLQYELKFFPSHLPVFHPAAFPILFFHYTLYSTIYLLLSYSFPHSSFIFLLSWLLFPLSYLFPFYINYFLSFNSSLFLLSFFALSSRHLRILQFFICSFYSLHLLKFLSLFILLFLLLIFFPPHLIPSESVLFLFHLHSFFFSSSYVFPYLAISFHTIRFLFILLCLFSFRPSFLPLPYLKTEINFKLHRTTEKMEWSESWNDGNDWNVRCANILLELAAAPIGKEKITLSTKKIRFRGFSSC